MVWLDSLKKLFCSGRSEQKSSAPAPEAVGRVPAVRRNAAHSSSSGEAVQAFETDAASFDAGFVPRPTAPADLLGIGIDVGVVGISLPPEQNFAGLRDIPKKPNTLLAQLTDTSYPPMPRAFPGLSVNRILELYGQQIHKTAYELPLSREEFDRLVLPVIRKTISYIHLLPASKNHHHRGMGGLLAHSFDVGLYSAREASQHIFDRTETSGMLYHNKSRWAFAAWMSGFLHDIGKSVVDMQVTSGGDVWTPYTMSLTEWMALNNHSNYFVTWRADRQHNGHQTAALSIVHQIVSKETIIWLGQYGSDKIWRCCEAAISGIETSPDLKCLLDVVIKADKKSTAKDIALLPEMDAKRLTVESQPAESILNGMKGMIASGTWKVNQPGARVWSTAQGVFIVWNDTIADELYTRLAADSNVKSVPKSASAMVQILEAQKCLKPTPAVLAVPPSLFWPVKFACMPELILRCLQLRQPNLVFNDGVLQPEPIPCEVVGIELSVNEKEAWDRWVERMQKKTAAAAAATESRSEGADEEDKNPAPDAGTAGGAVVVSQERAAGAQEPSTDLGIGIKPAPAAASVEEGGAAVASTQGAESVESVQTGQSVRSGRNAQAPSNFKPLSEAEPVVRFAASGQVRSGAEATVKDELKPGVKQRRLTNLGTFERIEAGGGGNAISVADMNAEEGGDDLASLLAPASLPDDGAADAQAPRSDDVVESAQEAAPAAQSSLGNAGGNETAQAQSDDADDFIASLTPARAPWADEDDRRPSKRGRKGGKNRRSNASRQMEPAAEDRGGDQDGGLVPTAEDVPVVPAAGTEDAAPQVHESPQTKNPHQKEKGTTSGEDACSASGPASPEEERVGSAQVQEAHETPEEAPEAVEVPAVLDDELKPEQGVPAASTSTVLESGEDHEDRQDHQDLEAHEEHAHDEAHEAQEAPLQNAAPASGEEEPAEPLSGEELNTPEAGAAPEDPQAAFVHANDEALKLLESLQNIQTHQAAASGLPGPQEGGALDPMTEAVLRARMRVDAESKSEDALPFERIPKPALSAEEAKWAAVYGPEACIDAAERTVMEGFFKAHTEAVQQESDRMAIEDQSVASAATESSAAPSVINTAPHFLPKSAEIRQIPRATAPAILPTEVAKNVDEEELNYGTAAAEANQGAQSAEQGAVTSGTVRTGEKAPVRFGKMVLKASSSLTNYVQERQAAAEEEVARSEGVGSAVIPTSSEPSAMDAATAAKAAKIRELMRQKMSGGRKGQSAEAADAYTGFGLSPALADDEEGDEGVTSVRVGKPTGKTKPKKPVKAVRPGTLSVEQRKALVALLEAVKQSIETRSGRFWSEPLIDNDEGVFILLDDVLLAAKELGIEKMQLVQHVNSTSVYGLTLRVERRTKRGAVRLIGIGREG